MNSPLMRRAVAGFTLAEALYTLTDRQRRRRALAALRGRPRQRKPSKPPAKPKPTRVRVARSDGLPPITTQRLFGASVANLDLEGVVERIIAWSDETPARTVITSNLDHAYKLRRDPLFRKAYQSADLITADGMPFVWLSRHEGTPLTERVAGSDLVGPLTSAAAEAGRSVFLFGTTVERLHLAAKQLAAANPKLKLAGVYAPPFGFERDPVVYQEMIEIIRAARPDIVFVALGAPKQEIFAQGVADSVRHGVFVSIGASLDFLSKKVRRAPRWVSKLGLEWVFRMIREPRRLGPRYARIIMDLPFILRDHKRDRRAHREQERRKALAVVSDRRYRDRRTEAHEQAAERAVEAKVDAGIYR